METVEEFMLRYFTEEPSAKYFFRWEAYSAPFRAKYFIPDYEAKHQKSLERYAKKRAAQPVVLSIEQNEGAALVFIADPRDFNHERCYDLQKTEKGWRIAGSYFKCFACKGNGRKYGYEENECSSCNGMGWRGNSATRRIKQGAFTQRIRQSSFAQSLSAMNEAENTETDKASKSSEVGRNNLLPEFMKESPFLTQVVEDLEAAYAKDYDDETRLLERLSGYLKPGRLIVLSGDSNSCNESFASLLVNYLVEGKSEICGVYCRNAKEFCRTHLAISSGIDLERLIAGRLEDEEWTGLTHTLGCMNLAPLYLENLPMTLDLLKSSLRNYASRCGGEIARKRACPVLIVGLQQLLVETIVAEKMAYLEGVALILRELKQLATEVQLPIVIINCSTDGDLNMEHPSIKQFADATATLKYKSVGQAVDHALRCIFSMSLNGRPVIAPTLLSIALSISVATNKNRVVKQEEETQ